MRSLKMHVSAIVLAAGRGVRFKSKISKALAPINSQPVIIYSLRTLSQHPLIKEIIIVTNPKNRGEIRNIVSKYHLKKVSGLVMGGTLRQDSVRQGLKSISLKTDLVLIHDAARPFITQKIVSAVIKAADKKQAAIVAVPVKATIKKIFPPSRGSDRYVKETLKRDNLWEIQTPQVFKKDLILEAYAKFANTAACDDATLVEKLGARVAVVEGADYNLKITTPADLVLARAILKNGRFNV